MMRARRSRSAGHVFGKHRGTKPLYASYAQSASCDAGDDARGGTGRTISAKRRKMPATCPKLPRPGSQARPARDGECLAYVGCTTQQEHRICAGYQRSTFTSQRAATPLSRTRSTALLVAPPRAVSPQPFAQALARGMSASAAYVEGGDKANRHNAACLSTRKTAYGWQAALRAVQLLVF